MTPQEADAEMYRRAVLGVRKMHRDGQKTVTPYQLSAACRVAYRGAVEFLERMEAEGVVSQADIQGVREILP